MTKLFALATLAAVFVTPALAQTFPPAPMERGSQMSDAERAKLLMQYTLPQVSGAKSRAGDVLTKFGLIGDLSDDCETTRTGQPGRANYVVRPDGMVEQHSFLATRNPSPWRILMIDAEIVSDTEIKIRAIHDPFEGETEMRFAKKGADFRHMSTRQLLDNGYSVKDGKFGALQTRWQHVCPDNGLGRPPTARSGN